VVAYVGQKFSTAIKERELQGKFVELAVAILREPPAEQNKPLRAWATEVIDRYSGLPFTRQTTSLLQDRLAFPTGPEWPQA
jgi:hypothetical protein